MKPVKFVLAVTAASVFVGAVSVARVTEDPGRRMAVAAKKLLDGLDEELRAKASFDFDDPERINWHFIPRDRKGVALKAMNPEQKDLFRGLVRTGAGTSGYDKAVAIMALEQVLRDIENTERSRLIRDPELYYVSIFGEPGETGTWGWRVEGHHLSMNYTIKDGKVVSETPIFYGANPAKVPSGPHQGLRTLAAEEDVARELYLTFEGDLKKQATIAEQAPRDILSGAQNKTPNPLPVEGIAVKQMDAAQRDLLKRLLQVYADRHPPEIAERMMTEIEKAGMDQVHFGWYGPSEPGQPHAYRVQGPTFLIEYNNTQNGANHVHSVWRNVSGEFGLAANP
jgi:hypothetical protein